MEDYTEASFEQHASSSHSGNCTFDEKKRRRRTTKKELQVLEALYEESRNPTYEARLKACNALGFEMKALQVWLQNRRQKEKKDSTKWKPSYTATGESASSSYSVSPRLESGAFLPSAASSTSNATYSDATNLQLPPIAHTLNQSSPHLKSYITLPPISTVMPENPLSRDTININNNNNKLSPMLHQDENMFTSSSTTCFSSLSTSSSRPIFERATSTDSAFSTSTCSSFNIQRQDLNKFSTSSKAISVSTATKSHSTLRRTSSQYSLSIANDGKAQMKLTEIPVSSNETVILKQHNKPTLPSLATAILQPSSSSSHSVHHSHPSFQVDTKHQTIPKQPLTLASAPLSLTHKSNPLPFSSLSTGRSAGRVLSLPSLSTISSKASINSAKSISGASIFAGGLRQGSPPKKYTPGFSSQLSSQDSQRQLWDNLDSDPIEPEDEALANHNKRLLDSPVRRISVRMEDVLSSSRKKRKAGGSPDDDLTASSTAKSTAIFGNHQMTINDSTSQTVLSSTPAKKSRLSMDIRVKDVSNDSRLPSMGISNFIRPRGYSKSMLSRSMSLDRAILQDDSTDEEHSPMKKGPQSAGLYQSSTFLGRPPLVRASTHVGLMHTDAAKPQDHLIANDITQMSSIGKSTITPNETDGEKDASGDEDEDPERDTSAAMQCTMSPSSIDTSAEEPDLTFSADASQSFDSLDPANISEAKVTMHSSLEFPTLNTRPLEKQPTEPAKHQSAKIAVSTPSKSVRLSNGALAQVARHGQMSSPIKMGSPTKNGKILTEVERDCAAVLVGLGFPDV